MRHSPDLDASSGARRTRIPEALRNLLRTADRQRLVDFVNTLEDAERTDDSDPDRGSWREHVRKHLFIAQFYLPELDQSIGIEAQQPALDAIREVLGHLVDLYCGKKFRAAEARELISNAEEISELLRTSFLKMVDIYDRGERITCVRWSP